MNPPIKSLSQFSSLEFTIAPGMTDKDKKEGKIPKAKSLSFLRQNKDGIKLESDVIIFDKIFDQLQRNTGIDLKDASQVKKIINLIRTAELGDLEFPPKIKTRLMNNLMIGN